MAVQPVADKREQYAQELEKFAHNVRNADDQPVGMLIHFFWQSGEITYLHKSGIGFSSLLSAGFLLREANRMTLVRGEK